VGRAETATFEDKRATTVLSKTKVPKNIFARDTRPVQLDFGIVEGTLTASICLPGVFIARTGELRGMMTHPLFPVSLQKSLFASEVAP
jgi:hypothetical protein